MSTAPLLAPPCRFGKDGKVDSNPCPANPIGIVDHPGFRQDGLPRTQRPIPRETSRRLQVAAFWAAMLVAGLHSMSGETWLALKTIVGMANMSVPLFFFLSGFFLSRHWGESGFWRREVRKRVVSLVIPYFSWLGVAALIFGLFIPGVKVWAGTMETFAPEWAYGMAFLRSIVGFPFLASFWFLRTLFLLVVLSPAWLWCVAAKGRIFAVASMGSVFLLWGLNAVYGVEVPFGSVLSRCGFSWRALFYVMAGAFVFHDDSLNILMKMRPSIGLGLGCWIVCAAVCQCFEVKAPVDFAMQVTVQWSGIWVTLALLSRVPLPEWVSKASMALYLSHAMFLNVLRELVFWRGTSGHGVYLWLACVLLGIGIWNVLRRGPRWMVIMFFGGRGRMDRKDRKED